MLHSISRRLTEWFFRHNWVEENNYTWCLYVVEKKLLQFCFLLILSICCIISNQYFNTLVFMATMYFLRRRMGGWNAPYNWMCILLTTVTTFIVLYIFAPVLMRINSLTMWTLDILLILAAFRTNPIYPPQLHFEQEIISSNRKKKNFTLVCITIIQVISVQLGFPQVLIFSFNGILVSILLIVAEKIKQKHGGFLYEAVE